MSPEAGRAAPRVLAELERASRRLVRAGRRGYVVVDLQAKTRAPRVKARTALALERAGLIAPASDVPYTDEPAYLISEAGMQFLRRAAPIQRPRKLEPVFVEAGGTLARAHRNREESPIGALAGKRRGLLSEDEVLAAEILRRDFTLAGLVAKTSASWPQQRIDGARRHDLSPLDASARAEAARARYIRALKVLEPIEARLASEVCCHLHSLKVAERTLRLPARSGRMHLKLALGALARHYGIAAGAARRSRVTARSFGDQ